MAVWSPAIEPASRAMVMSVSSVSPVSTAAYHSGRDVFHRIGAKMTVARRPRIALLAAPETSASVLYGLYDVLQSVGPGWPDMTAAEPGEPLLDVSIVAASAE